MLMEGSNIVRVAHIRRSLFYSRTNNSGGDVMARRTFKAFRTNCRRRKEASSQSSSQPASQPAFTAKLSQNGQFIIHNVPLSQCDLWRMGQTLARSSGTAKKISKTQANVPVWGLDSGRCWRLRTDMSLTRQARNTWERFNTRRGIMLTWQRGHMALHATFSDVCLVWKLFDNVSKTESVRAHGNLQAPPTFRGTAGFINFVSRTGPPWGNEWFVRSQLSLVAGNRSCSCSHRADTSIYWTRLFNCC